MSDYLIGNTIKPTWINSTNTPTDLYFSVFNNSGTSVDSATMIDSGDAHHYYGLHTIINTPGDYVLEMKATIAGRPYKNRIPFRAITQEA